MRRRRCPPSCNDDGLFGTAHDNVVCSESTGDVRLRTKLKQGTRADIAPSPCDYAPLGTCTMDASLKIALLTAGINNRGRYS
jgi:hypothetical protein